MPAELRKIIGTPNKALSSSGVYCLGMLLFLTALLKPEAIPYILGGQSLQKDLTEIHSLKTEPAAVYEELSCHL